MRGLHGFLWPGAFAYTLCKAVSSDFFGGRQRRSTNLSSSTSLAVSSSCFSSARLAAPPFASGPASLTLSSSAPPHSSPSQGPSRNSTFRHQRQRFPPWCTMAQDSAVTQEALESESGGGPLSISTSTAFRPNFGWTEFSDLARQEDIPGAGHVLGKPELSGLQNDVREECFMPQSSVGPSIWSFLLSCGRYKPGGVTCIPLVEWSAWSTADQ